MTSPALKRLDRLETYLIQDPENGHLLADAFGEALGAGAFARAEFHLRHAQALGLDPRGWHRRKAHWLLAQHRWGEARQCLLELLERVAPSLAEVAIISHDLAYLELRAGNFEGGLDWLSPHLQAPPTVLAPAIHVLWLQLLHRAERLDDAMAWLKERDSSGSLSSSVAGVGSLVALDAADYEAALNWSERNLAERSPRVEALVTRASLALAQPDAALARELFQAALHVNNDDGRVWSGLAYAELLDQRLPKAREAFDRATLLLGDHPGTWHGLGWTALAQSDLAAAGRAFDEALRLDRNFAESHGSQAVVSALVGRREAADAAVGRALRLDRACLSARYAEALLRGDAGDPANLMRLANRLFQGRSSPMGGLLIDVIRGARSSDYLR